MPKAKSQTTKTKAKAPAKPKTPTIDIEAIKEELRQEIMQQLEIMIPDQEDKDAFVDMDLLKKEIAEQVDFAQKKAQHVAEIENKADVSLSRSNLKLIGEKEYDITSSLDGLLISEGDKALITASKSGAIGFGLKAPRSFGVGSAHFRAVYPSEAPIPTNGVNSTRGVIVEGDGDDDKTYSFRAVSRMNRQGFNITSDGNLVFGLMNDGTRSKATFNNTRYDSDTINLFAGSKQYANNLLNMQTGSLENDRFNFINAVTDVKENGKPGIEMFKVDGLGTVSARNCFQSNKTGYAELFEWADGNNKSEDRIGFTVALDENGHLIVANEGDNVIGVVSDKAAVVGNAGWTYTNTYLTAENKTPKKQTVKIVEWEDEVGILHTHYEHTLDPNFSLPDNAVIYETDENGDAFSIPFINAEHNRTQEYIPRSNRGWATVTLVGKVAVWKGQYMSSNWIKVRDLNDDLEEWILK